MIDLKVDIEGYELDGLPEWIESGALEKVFWSQNLIQPEYILPGGPAGYGASPEENTPRKEVRFRPWRALKSISFFLSSMNHLKNILDKSNTLKAGLIRIL